MPAAVFTTLIPAVPLLLCASAAMAAEPPTLPADGIVAIVRVPKPWYAPRMLVTHKMLDTKAQYAALPGLLFKAYSFEQTSGDFGGAYFWRSRADAKAWFNADWFARVKRERGVEGQVRLLDAPVSIDNTPGGTAASDDSPAVATLVEIPLPAGLTPERLRAAFAAAVPEYRAVPGLLRKHFTMTLDAPTPTFGGVYLWRDTAAAQAWLNDDWHARVVKAYGQDARIEWFDTPILLPVPAAAPATQP